MMHQNQTSKCN